MLDDLHSHSGQRIILALLLTVVLGLLEQLLGGAVNVEYFVAAPKQLEALLRLEESGLFPIQITERAPTATIISRRGAPGPPQAQKRAPAKAQKKSISKPSRGFKIKRKHLSQLSM